MGTDFPRSWLRTIIAEDDAARDTSAARHTVPIDTMVASVTGIDAARSRLRPSGEEWRLAAACRDMDPGMFYPGPHENYLADLAREVCAGCGVRRECLEFAVAHHERIGIWGGKSERERRRLRPSSAKDGAA